VKSAPDGWILLPPGDAALTRRVKAAGDHWVVQERKGRKVFSRGVWASAATIERIQADLNAERSTESFAKKKEADARRRDKAQAEYIEDFLGAVVSDRRSSRMQTEQACKSGHAFFMGLMRIYHE
jgi:hypothetical protein